MAVFSKWDRSIRAAAGAWIVLIAAPGSAVAQTGAAFSLRDIFRAAAAANQSQATYAADLELAELRKNKADIEAKTDSDRLSAESTYLSALADYRRSTLTYFNETVDTLFAAATAELDKEISDIRVQTAQEDRRIAQSKQALGMISQEGLEESELALRTAAADNELAYWNHQDALTAVQRSIGMEWSSRLLPQVPAFQVGGTREAWVESDTAVRRARVSLKIANLRLALLPSNSSGFDRRIQEAEVKKAQIAAEKAEGDAGRAFDAALRRLENQRAVYQIRLEESRLKQVSLADALRRYDRGLISLGERNTQRISELTTRKNLLQAQRTYLKTMGEIRSALGADPLGW